MTDMADIFMYDPNKVVDYYKILNSNPGSTSEQILAEYKVLARTTHPDKTEEKSSAAFQLILEAKEVLTDSTERALYDRWRQSGISLDYRTWRGMNKQAPCFHWRTAPTRTNMVLSANQTDGAFENEHSEIKRFEAFQGQAFENVQIFTDDSDSVVKRFRRYQI